MGNHPKIGCSHERNKMVGGDWNINGFNGIELGYNWDISMGYILI